MEASSRRHCEDVHRRHHKVKGFASPTTSMVATSASLESLAIVESMSAQTRDASRITARPNAKGVDTPLQNWRSNQCM